MNTQVGTCSLCGGPVSTPTAWMSVRPPVPQCESCGAYAAQPHGDVIEMAPPRQGGDDRTSSFLKGLRG
jgi:hypothetical protein